MIEVLGIKNADKLVPIDDDQTPRDPVSENMSFLTGQPTKAFIYQDHDAHIAVHTSMMQDPMVMGQLGQNPMAQQIQGAIMAHVAQHLAFQYRQKLQEQLGVSLPPPDAAMDEQTEVQVSKLVAQAATQLLQMDKAKAAQQQAMQQAQDPIIQMQQAELQIKQQETQIKAQKVQGELALKQAELQLKAQEMQSKQGENPEMIAQRHQQEMAMQQQRHAMELAQAQRAHEMDVARAQQLHGQKVDHANENQSLQAKAKMLQMALAAKQTQNKPKPAKGE
jgi:hypothetical protein